MIMKKCSSCTAYIVLFVIFLTTSIKTLTVLLFAFYWYSKKDTLKEQFIKGINRKYQTNQY